jgi:hypothetical protein
MDRSDGCVLSVVVAHTDPEARLSRALAALEATCRGLSTEVIVAQPVARAADPAPRSDLPVTTLQVAGDPLVPQLWACGAESARGTYVAFTLSNCEVSAGWAHEILRAFADGADGVGGPLVRAPELGMLDRAVYYLRYSAFTPARMRDATISGEIAGDNAAYRRSALEAHRDVIAQGFWEVLFHDALRKSGGTLCTRKAAAATFRGGVRFSTILAHRFAHGRHFGAWRVVHGQRRPWQILLAAPVVPALLLLRAAKRMVPISSERRPFCTCLPLIGVVAAAWSAGEAVGAIRGATLPRIQVVDHAVPGRLA